MPAEPVKPASVITTRYSHHSHGELCRVFVKMPMFDNSARATNVMLEHCLTQISYLVMRSSDIARSLW